ncbi:MAG: hypothetical protein ACYDBJ_01945 [Aggregatilineales bacterium]
MKHVVLRHGLFLLLIALAALPSSVAAHIEAQIDPPCNGWALHTRTLSTICPEVILDGLTGQGVAAIGSIAFDANGDLYVSRPATGQVLRLTPHDGNFDPPAVIASGLDFPGGLACSGDICYTATDTTITRLTDGKAMVIGLPSGDLRPLRIGSDGRLYTTRGKQTISLAIDGTDEHPVAEISTPPLDFAWSSNGTLWFSDGNQSVRSIHAEVAFAPASAPSGIAFYPNTPDLAFPQFGGGLLVVTSGSWNTTTIDGYELWIVPFVASDRPGTPIRLIPADTERSSADAALVALSFFPDHPIAVAISPEGWIYAATREGRVIRLRPRRK